MYRIVFSALLLIGLAHSAWAEWDETWDVYKRRNYTRATREFITLAEQGDARAQHTLRVMDMVRESMPWFLVRYHERREEWESQCNAPKFKKAADWFRSAADRGDVKAQTVLASMYEFGCGVPQEFSEALKMLHEAAEKGEVLAQKTLGFYSAFLGKREEAAGWIKKAAEQGDPLAQEQHGLSYSEENKVKGYMWLDLAAAQGLKRAEIERDKLTKTMTLAQVAKAQNLAQNWREKHGTGQTLDPVTALAPDGTPLCLAGANFQMIDFDATFYWGPARVMIAFVEPESLAWKLGLRGAAAVFLVNDQEVSDLEEFWTAAKSRGGSVTLETLSGGRFRTWRCLF